MSYCLKTLKTHQKAIVGLILVIFGLSLAGQISAGAPFTDNFNSYNLGEIVGQGFWQGNTGNWAVVDSDCFELQCISKVAGGYLYGLAETPLDFGTWIIYIKPTNGYNGLFEITWSPTPYTVSNVLVDNGDLKFFTTQGYKTIKSPLPLNEWSVLTIEWQKISESAREMRIKYNNEDFTEWWPTLNYPVGGVVFGASTPTKFDFISDIPYAMIPEIEGLTPETGTEITDLTDVLTIKYLNLDWETYDGFIVNFRDNKIGVIADSIQFLKDDLNESGTGQVEINLQDFNFDSNGHWDLTGLAFGTHLDIEGGMFLTTRGYIDFFSDELVLIPYYLLINVEGLPTPYTFSAPEDWYSENVDRFDTPTAFFTAFIGLIAPVFEKVGEFGIRVQGMFDQNEAYEKGYALGEIFPLISGYIQKIDLFFGGFPLVSFFKYLILTMLAIFIIRAVMKFIPFFG